MNPFDTYPGLTLNGKFYPAAKLHVSAVSKKRKPFEKDILNFAAEIFGKGAKIKVETSGSTGKPKPMRFSKKAFVLSAQSTNKFFNLDENTVALLSLPLRYIAGKMMVIRAIVGQYNLIAVEPSSLPLAENDLPAIDFAPFTPFQVEGSLEETPRGLAAINAVLIGGGPVSDELRNQLQATGVRAYASFGMTETLSHFALTDLSLKELIYKPLAGVQVKTNKEGCLKVKWTGMTDGWLQTNDLVELHPDGFIWLGRKDNLINSGGVKVIPERVEKQLALLITGPYFIAGVPHKRLGEEVTLFVEEAGAGKLRLSDIQHAMAESPFYQPRKLVYLKKFLYTASGKIRRKDTVHKWMT